MAGNPFKSGKRLKQKAIPSFLGDVGLIKVVSEFSFGHSKCHFSVPENGHFWQKWPSSGALKWHFGCPNKNSETTFISPTSPKIDGIAFRFKRVPLLEGYPANFKIQYFLQCDIAILGTPLIGGLKCISQEFFMVLFYTTELQYKSRGPKDMKNMTNKGKSSSYTDREPQMAFYIAY